MDCLRKLVVNPALAGAEFVDVKAGQGPYSSNASTASLGPATWLTVYENAPRLARIHKQLAARDYSSKSQLQQLLQEDIQAVSAALVSGSGRSAALEVVNPPVGCPVNLHICSPRMEQSIDQAGTGKHCCTDSFG
jgi:hypothetical protein